MSGFSTDIDKWFFAPAKGRPVNMRLFCFPFGGGGASFYRTWTKGLPPDLELCAVQLPGRESRLREEPYTRLMPLVEALSGIIETFLDTPFAFFGHSMGALISFELTRQLRRENKNSPIHLFVSGRRAPQIESHDLPKHNLPKSEFIKELGDYNGTPELILQEPELLDIFLPCLRADFSIIETYIHEYEEPIDCPITAFGGIHDSKTKFEDLAAWRANTNLEFRLKMFPGDHFYLKNARKLLLQEIAQDLEMSLVKS